MDMVTQTGHTPLHQAAQQGHRMSIDLLLSKGASANVLTKVMLFNKYIEF